MSQFECLLQSRQKNIFRYGGSTTSKTVYTAYTAYTDDTAKNASTVEYKPKYIPIGYHTSTLR